MRYRRRSSKVLARRSGIGGRRLALEPLEDRMLLSGVTLLTHGFGGSASGWLTEMAGAISSRPEVSSLSQYTVTVTDPDHDGGDLSVVNTGSADPGPASTDSAEILILLDWSDVSGGLSLENYHRSTSDVAAAVASALTAPGFLGSFAGTVAELPLHLIGHSRGGSLVTTLAHELGSRGIWVDQVTTLDPHPIDGVREPITSPDWGDAAVAAWSNVVFADNYWRTDGDSSLDFTGEPVSGSYNVQLEEDRLSGEGYASEHSDVHLWYHGTIDTTAGANDGSADVPASWYGGTHPQRESTGYFYSRLVAGVRPAAGIATSLGGEAGRTDIDWTAAAWPNVLNMTVDATGTQVAKGDSFRVAYWYQDFDSDSTTTFFFDVDTNPYNGNEIQAASKPETKTDQSPRLEEQLIPTDSASAGSTYYVFAKVADEAGHTRFAYAPGTIQVINEVVHESAIFTWDGAPDGGGASADANWTTASNWVSDVAPSAKDALVFSGTTQQASTNDFAAGTTFQSITFVNGGFDLQGNSLVLDGAGTAELVNEAGVNTIGFDFSLDDSSDGASTIQFAAGELVLTGNVLDSDDTNLVITGPGRLALGPAAAIGFDGDIIVTAAGATLALGANDQIDNDAGLLVEQGGVFEIGAFNETLAGVTLTSGGVIRGTTGQLTSTSAFDVQAGTVDAILAGAVGLAKTTAGTVTLEKTNGYTGETTVQAGRLDVNGTPHADSNVVVKNGATLGGVGNINGQVTAEAGAAIAPGEGEGTGVLATGEVQFLDSSTFAAGIRGTAPGAGHDQLQVTGTISIGSSVALVLSIPAGAFRPLPGDVFVLIANDGSDTVAGTFQGLPQGAILDDFLGLAGTTAHITYTGGDGNDVAIVVDTAPVEIDLSGISLDAEDRFTLRRAGANLRLTNSAGADLLNLPLAGVTQLTVNGEAGEDDTFVISFTGGNPIPAGGIAFNGQVEDSDRLVISGGTFNTVTTTYTNSNSGSVNLDAGIARFTGLTPVLINAGTIANAVFNLPAGPNTDAILGDDGQAWDPDGVNDANTSAIDGSTFEFTQFTNPTESLTVNLGPRGDSISLRAMDVLFAPNRAFIIAGGRAGDTFRVEAPQPVEILGGGSSDRLFVTDEAAGDVTLIRKGQDGAGGSITVSPALNPLGPVVFTSVEYVQVTPVDPVSGRTGIDSAGRVVQFDLDPLEMNDTRLNATPYNLLSQIGVRPAIDPGGDEDWYSFVAPEDSSFRFDLRFDAIAAADLANGRPGLPGNGELLLDIYNASGALIASGAPSANGRSVLLSLQNQSTYYARVRGSSGDAVNVYDLRIENTKDTFENGLAAQFRPFGYWTVDREGENAMYRGASDPSGNAIAVFTGPLLDKNGTRAVEVTFNTKDLIPGPRWSNAFIAFGFDPNTTVQPTDFRFAGAFVGVDRWVIGHSANNRNGYENDALLSDRIDATTDHRIRVTMRSATPAAGQTLVELFVHNGATWVKKVEHAFNEDFFDPAKSGVGLLTMRGIAWFDDFADPDAATTGGGTNSGPADPVKTNTVPVARSDSATTTAGNAFTIDVLANDSDPDNDRLTVESVAYTGSGSVRINENGTITYTPASAITGTDRFDYRIRDGRGGAAAGTVTLQINPAPPADPAPVTQSAFNFDDGTAGGLTAVQGTWQVIADPAADHAGDRSYLGRADSGKNAIALGPARGALPQSIEVTATINADNPVPGKQWSNGFILFDYIDAANFKFAGTFFAKDQWVIGRAAKNADGYVIDKVFSEQIDTLTDYGMKLTLTGNTATLSVLKNGEYREVVSRQYSGDDLRDGRIGVGTFRATARFDDFTVREIAAAATSAPTAPAAVQESAGTSGTMGSSSPQTPAGATEKPPAAAANSPAQTPPAAEVPEAGKGAGGTAQTVKLAVKHDFDDGASGKLAPKAGLWRVDGSKYVAQPQTIDQNLVSLLSLDRELPEKVEAKVTFNADASTSTRWSNAFLIFDYRGPTDYKFAGAFLGIGQWAIGRMTPRGYAIDTSLRDGIEAGKDYTLHVRLDGANVAMIVDGVAKVSHTYTAPLQNGQLGLATLRGNARFDDFSVEEF